MPTQTPRSRDTRDILAQERLFGEAPLPVQRPARYPTRAAQFTAFDAAHPEVFRAFLREARRFLRQRRQMSAVGILSLIRPSVGRGITNSFAPYYARKAIDTDPRLDQVLKLRPLQTDAPLSPHFVALPALPALPASLAASLASFGAGAVSMG